MRSLLLVTLLIAGCHGNHVKLHKFLQENGDDFLNLMQESFAESVSELFRSATYKDQSLEKPGMSKLFREQSDKRWEEGISYLQKFLQRGGTVFGKNDGSFSINARHYGEVDYATDLATLKERSADMAKEITKLHQRDTALSFSNNYHKYDADLAHFLEEKLEDEFENLRSLTILGQIFSDLGDDKLAQHIFDQNL